jgi:alanyl-tRNA synthetase
LGGAAVIVRAVDNVSPDEMRQLIDVMRRKCECGLAVLLAVASDGKVQLVAGLSKDLIDRGLHAGNWLKEVAPIVGGGGGGRPDLAQAGGKDPSKIPAALELGLERIRSLLES